MNDGRKWMDFNDSTKVLEPKVLKKIRIETPVGAIESDSGSHMIDGLTIVILVLALYAGKKIVDKYIKINNI
jgi:hypothetical protein